MPPAPQLAPLHRTAVERGDWSAVRAVVLRTRSEAGRRRGDGADAIAAHLARPGPGEVRLWESREWPTGVALTFEWTGASGTDRRRCTRARRPTGVSRSWGARGAAPAGGVEERWSAPPGPGGGGRRRPRPARRAPRGARRRARRPARTRRQLR